ncbi:hypothetical protein [Paenibacillus silviterrae]|uniref:hypothetical protein n=1 Tax=Paenibacillus silviterrae TaxID=3242194 RepID=UPI0025435315|nr:hypothetical protein [Paenibacillus chinjuensis]
MKASDISYRELLVNYASNRFCKPSEVNPIQLKQLELDVLHIAEVLNYRPVELSPAAPLGSCSVVAPANQNKVISALRGTEIVADATNMLALYMCEAIKSGTVSNVDAPLRLCTTHRHVRAQRFDMPGLLPHFQLFCMVTSGKDRGSYLFEKEAIVEHLQMYETLFNLFENLQMTVVLQRRGGYKDSSGLIGRLSEHIQLKNPLIKVMESAETNENAYYRGLQFTVIITVNGQENVIGDGGYVDWSQKLLGSKKERMLISAIGLERLLPVVRLIN